MFSEMINFAAVLNINNEQCINPVRPTSRLDSLL
jgi:hypothetical protein